MIRGIQQIHITRKTDPEIVRPASPSSWEPLSFFPSDAIMTAAEFREQVVFGEMVDTARKVLPSDIDRTLPGYATQIVWFNR